MSPADRPNILLIMADQLVPMLTGAYGHPVVRTPALDRLAREGVRFDAAYSPCPVCAPARAALMTGRYVSAIGAWDNAAPFGCDEPTFCHGLASAGYDCTLSGKMHFIGPDQLHGFARRLTGDLYPCGFDWTPVRGRVETSERSHARYYVDESIQVGRWSEYLSFDEETQFRAREYLRHAAELRRSGSGAGRPFLLCVSFHHPHEPFWPPARYWDKYENDPIELPELPAGLEAGYSIMDRWLNVNHGVEREARLRLPDSLRRLRRAYYALVSYIDDKVSELLDTLTETGLDRNTVVIFTSDHGDMLVEKGMVQKRTFYEWSSRIPLIMRFPDGRHAGARRYEPVNLVDLRPTMLELAGVAPELESPLDGASLLELLEAPRDENRCTFSEYHSQGVHAACFMARRGRFKYILVNGHDRQLFDLEADPHELRNLAGRPEHAAEQAELHARILSRFDPQAIEAAVSRSIVRRGQLKTAMQRSGPQWFADPKFDYAKPIPQMYSTKTMQGEGK